MRTWLRTTVPLVGGANDAGNGKPMPCCFWTNAKGGVTVDFGIRYNQGCVEPCLPDLSPENPALLIMDGHGSHFNSLELLQYCRVLELHTSALGHKAYVNSIPVQKVGGT